ncbi:MAG: AmmeMemoRadiSam system protein B [Planctomycetes bacterium]|nr:AmmeMemoRadiSam system protein B [Planctomycetota bacterium]
MASSKNVRPPAVAGRFYPGARAPLREAIDESLRAAPAAPGARRRAIGVVLPHAGYEFCGAVSGAVFAAVEAPARALVIGFKHRRPRPGAFLWSGGAWATPLGEAEIDEPLRAALRRECEGLEESEEQFEGEWSIEAQVPWLQAARPDVSINAVAVNALAGGPDAVVALGRGLARAISAAGGDRLLVASSDIAHENEESLARAQCAEAARWLAEFDSRRLMREIEGREIGMCGLLPVAVMYAAAREMGARRATVVATRVSADVARSPDGYTVAYAGVVVD